MGQRSVSPRTTNIVSELNHPREVSTLVTPGRIGPIYSVQWSRGDSYIACGSGDGTIDVYDAGAGSLITSLEGHTHAVKCLEWCKATPEVLYSGGRDGSLLIWDLRRYGERRLAHRIEGGSDSRSTNGRPPLHEPRSVTAMVQPDGYERELITSCTGNG